MNFIDLDLDQRHKLADVVRHMNGKGLSPATSTNYSLKSEVDGLIWISKSGVDKHHFSHTDFIPVDVEGKIHPDYLPNNLRTSAETELHLDLYKTMPEVRCVLHTHSKFATVLSMQKLAERKLIISDLELLKGLSGNKTHEMSEVVPVVRNSQEMKDIISELKNHPDYEKCHGYLIAGHGLYTWGKNIEEAKRHIETFEFLFECLYLMEK